MLISLTRGSDSQAIDLLDGGDPASTGIQPRPPAGLNAHPEPSGSQKRAKPNELSSVDLYAVPDLSSASAVGARRGKHSPKMGERVVGTDDAEVDGAPSRSSSRLRRSSSGASVASLPSSQQRSQKALVEELKLAQEPPLQLNRRVSRSTRTATPTSVSAGSQSPINLEMDVL